MTDFVQIDDFFHVFVDMDKIVSVRKVAYKKTEISFFVDGHVRKEIFLVNCEDLLQIFKDRRSSLYIKDS